MAKVIGQALETARVQQRTTLAECENKRLMAILEYVAMMADVDIEEENDDAQQDV